MTYITYNPIVRAGCLGHDSPIERDTLEREGNMRPLYEIAEEIQREGKGKGWYNYAKPYVEAMLCLNLITDNYAYDSGRSVVNYALANLTYWRGDVARAVKAELNAMLKQKEVSA